MRYAMILLNRVIGILSNQETAPEWPPDDKKNPVVAVPCDEIVELGMMYNFETGEFTYPEIKKPTLPEPTQLDNIEATQLTIMTAMAEQYEESLERELVNMEVQATIYEAILEMGGAV